RSNMDGNGAEERVWIRVRDQDERGTADAFELESGIEPAAVLRNQLEKRRDEGGVSGTARVRPLRLDATHELRIEEETGVEQEPPPAHVAGGDTAGSFLLEGADEVLGRRDGVAWEAEPARKHARAAARNAAERRCAGAEAVRHLVESPVPRVDEDRVDVVPELPRELRRMAAPLRQVRRDITGTPQCFLDERDPVLVNGACEWVDDQRDAGHAWQPCHASTPSPSPLRVVANDKRLARRVHDPDFVPVG